MGCPPGDPCIGLCGVLQCMGHPTCGQHTDAAPVTRERGVRQARVELHEGNEGHGAAAGETFGRRKGEWALNVTAGAGALREAGGGVTKSCCRPGLQGMH